MIIVIFMGTKSYQVSAMLRMECLHIYSNTPRGDGGLFGFSGRLNVCSFLILMNSRVGTEIKKQSVKPENRDSIPGEGIALFLTSLLTKVTTDIILA
jgi:hypothetical protein